MLCDVLHTKPVQNLQLAGGVSGPKMLIETGFAATR
jgi:hypothetical protein